MKRPQPAIQGRVALICAGLVVLAVFLLFYHDCGVGSDSRFIPAEQRIAQPILQPKPQQPVAAAATSAVFTEARLLQKEFCHKETASLAASTVNATEGDYFWRDSVAIGLGRAGLNISMWLHAKPDIVSEHINRTGYWEWHETEQILNSLAKFEQVG